MCLCLIAAASGLYSRLTRVYQQTGLDASISELMRLVEVLSAYVELDVNVALLVTSNCTVAHMFPSHPFVLDAQAFKSHLRSRPSHIFPTRSTSEQVDVARWITAGRGCIDTPPKPSVSSAPASSPTSSSSLNLRSPPPPVMVASLVSVPLVAARLHFLMLQLKERSALTTAPLVFGLSTLLVLPPAALEALLREHILLLYERGEDTRAWECVPRLEDPLCMASVLIGVGRTRLGLFLHALEAKSAPKYAQLVSAVPAAAWQWLSKARPPSVISKRQEQHHRSNKSGIEHDGAAASSSTGMTAASLSSGPSASQYLLSDFMPAPIAGAAFDPLLLMLTRTVTIRQKASDIDINATLTALKRAKAILEHALGQTTAGAAVVTPGGSVQPRVAVSEGGRSANAPSPVQGQQFGSQGDNHDSMRRSEPIRSAAKDASTRAHQPMHRMRSLA
jgi:hypothetical protein